MVLGSPSEPLSQLEVLVVDCQATAAAPRGHLLEIGWGRVLGTTITHTHASLIALPDGEQIPPAVARITGISDHMRSEEHTSELQSPCNLVCRLLLEKKNIKSFTRCIEHHK